jgi:serine/threonine protein kinase
VPDPDETRDAPDLPTPSHSDPPTATRAGKIVGTITPNAGEPGAASPPEPIPGYEILGELGCGGMGVVYRARQVGLGREVALKVLGRAGLVSEAVARFRAEAEVMAAVKHPHVVHVIELGEHDGRPFIAMEYVPGGNLAGWIKARAPAPPWDAAALVAKVADGVAAAHEVGVVHRDLKPANVILDAAGEPKVTDFGLAKRRSADLTATQAMMGTPAYVAPEQAAMRATFVGPPADVWALGVILYECVIRVDRGAAPAPDSLTPGLQALPGVRGRRTRPRTETYPDERVSGL